MILSVSNMQIIKLYKYIFYLLFKFFIKVSRKDIPESKAIVLMCLWIGLYLLIPYGLIRYAMTNYFKISNWVFVSIYVILCLVHFIYLLSAKKYLHIYRDFERDFEYRNKYKIIPLLLFLSLPIIVPIIFTFTIWK